MVISTLSSAAFGFPEAVDGAKAAALAINNAGGINGQQVKILSCNDQFDPNTAASCAQQAVADKVDAVVTGYTAFGSNIVPILQNADIPWIGNSPGSSAELNSPINFPLDPGAAGIYATVAHSMYAAGCRKLAILTDTQAAAVLSGTAAKADFTQDGGTVVYSTTVPDSVADVTSFVTASINSGADCIIPVIPPTNYIKFLTATRQSSKPTIMLANSGLPDTALTQLGAVANGLYYAAATYPVPSAPQAQTFDAQMKAEGKAPADFFSHQAWAGVTVFAEAAKGLTNVNNQTILASLNKLTVKLSTFPDPITFSAPESIKGTTRIFNTIYVPSTVKDGHLVQAGAPYNVLHAVQAALGNG
jgi:ABC-type branched-subunit amino acid transport system substrate-binding protein